MKVEITQEGQVPLEMGGGQQLFVSFPYMRNNIFFLHNETFT